MIEPNDPDFKTEALRYFMRECVERQAEVRELTRLIYEMMEKLPEDFDRVALLASIPDRLAAAREKEAADQQQRGGNLSSLFPPES